MINLPTFNSETKAIFFPENSLNLNRLKKTAVKNKDTQSKIQTQQPILIRALVFSGRKFFSGLFFYTN